VDDTFLILLNAHHEPLPFTLPAHQRGVRWTVVVDTRTADGRRRYRPLRPGETYEMEARSVAVFMVQSAEERRRNGEHHARHARPESRTRRAVDHEPVAAGGDDQSGAAQPGERGAELVVADGEEAGQ
jgi:hypothetical protein